MNKYSVIIVGGGISGLTCANYLQKTGINCLVLESSETLGGRVQTHEVDGYLLDRGFQVLQTNYPEAKQLLDYEVLDLKPFKSGAYIRKEGGFLTMQNPFRNPMAFLPMAFSSVGTLMDKLRIAKLIGEVRRASTDELMAREGIATYDFLKNYGFSEKIINTFFRPFFGGVFLEEELITASNFFLFTFKQFFEGDAAIPANGMREIPMQLAANLSEGSIRIASPVVELKKNSVTLANGEFLEADYVVLAVNIAAADKLLGISTERVFNATNCLYFSADFSPLNGKPFLTLNPNRKQLVHHICVPSDLATQYAPEGKTLISVTIRNAKGLSAQRQIEQVKRELGDWFGASVNAWRLLATYDLPQAVSLYSAGSHHVGYHIDKGVYQCGDYTAYPSLNAAMKTGREVAEMIIKANNQPK